MRLTRLSSVATLVRAWLSSRSAAAARESRALAECRKLKAELKQEQHQRQQDEAAAHERHEIISTNTEHLAAIVAEQERELAAKDREIKRLEVELDVAKLAHERIAELRACETSALQVMSARHAELIAKAIGSYEHNGHNNLF